MDIFDFLCKRDLYSKYSYCITFFSFNNYKNNNLYFLPPKGNLLATGSINRITGYEEILKINKNSSNNYISIDKVIDSLNISLKNISSWLDINNEENEFKIDPLDLNDIKGSYKKILKIFYGYNFSVNQLNQSFCNGVFLFKNNLIFNDPNIVNKLPWLNQLFKSHIMIFQKNVIFLIQIICPNGLCNLNTIFLSKEFILRSSKIDQLFKIYYY